MWYPFCIVNNIGQTFLCSSCIYSSHLTAFYLHRETSASASHSDFVGHNAALSNAFSNKEPESDLSSNQGVQPGLLYTNPENKIFEEQNAGNISSTNIP